MQIKILKPYLVTTTKDGKELYLDPSDNRLCSRELAFANFEGLKNDAKKLVYLDELRLKNSSNKSECNINVIDEPEAVKVKAYSRTEKNNNIDQDDYFNRLNDIQEEVLEIKELIENLTSKDLPVIPFLKTARSFIIRFFFKSDDLISEDDELNSDTRDGDSRQRQKKKKFMQLA